MPENTNTNVWGESPLPEEHDEELLRLAHRLDVYRDPEQLCLAKTPSLCVFLAFQPRLESGSKRLLTVKISGFLFSLSGGWSFGEAQAYYVGPERFGQFVIPGSSSFPIFGDGLFGMRLRLHKL
jgi:hypothetical protein